jgi:hypothetical protein
LALAALVGLVAGIAAFELTSTVPLPAYGGFCTPVANAGFDPWTGLPHGPTLACTARPVANPTMPVVTTEGVIEPDLAARRAIPVPLGFVLGAGLVLVVSAAAGVRRRLHPIPPGFG